MFLSHIYLFLCKPISLEIYISMSKVNFCAFVSCLHSYFRQGQLTSVYWEIYLYVFWFACPVGRVNRAGSRGISSWHCSCEGSSHLALLWRRPGSNKLHTELLKIRAVLLQIKLHSSLHLDTAQYRPAHRMKQFWPHSASTEVWGS